MVRKMDECKVDGNYIGSRDGAGVIVPDGIDALAGILCRSENGPPRRYRAKRGL